MTTETRRNLSDDALTDAVIASFAGTPSARTREIMQSLVKHLHAFVKDVQLTEAEWFQGIEFLTRTGHITDDKRQEFILLSDVLGVSMLVVGLGAGAGDGPQATATTEATVFGPFFVEGSPSYPNGADIANGAPGEPCYMEGRILSTSGEPVAGARIEIWQADDQGFYDVQYSDLSDMRGRGNLTSAADGRYWFWSVKPEAYPIPHDGPVGDMLKAAQRSPMRPAHVHFMISAPGYKPVITHVFAGGDPYLDTDAVFGVKSSLITDFTRHEPGLAPDGKQIDRPFYTATYDFVLMPA
jgi:hydroxyquinol 1,2-dioxygenase